MDPIDLPSLLSASEGETLDFKSTSYNLSDDKAKRDLAKDLACLANTPRVGDSHLILGVEKPADGIPILHDIDSDVDDADLQSVANSRLEPCPRFSYHTMLYNDTVLGVITVRLGPRTPVVPKKTFGEGFEKDCIYFRRGSQNAKATMQEQGRIWDWYREFNSQGAHTGSMLGRVRDDRPYFDDRSLDDRSDTTELPRHYSEGEALLLGPFQALGLTARIERAEQLTASAPIEAAQLYEEIAGTLNERFPIHAEKFEQLRVEALEKAGEIQGSYEALMELAIRDIFERAEPHPSSGVAHRLEALLDKVNRVQRARGAALVLAGC